MGGQQSRPAPPPPPPPPAAPAPPRPAAPTPPAPVVRPVAPPPSVARTSSVARTPSAPPAPATVTVDTCGALTQQSVSAMSCATRKVAHTGRNSDTALLYNSLRTCDPATVRTETAAQRDALRTYHTTTAATLAAVLADHTKQVTLADSMLETMSPLQQYATELSTDAAALEQEERKLEHAQRKHRRSFLDGGAQEGVWGVAGVKTHDEKTLLALWICVAAAAAVATVVLLHMYGVEDRRAVLGGAGAAAAVVLGATVGLVYRFA
jgi:hypothetical protein